MTPIVPVTPLSATHAKILHMIRVDMDLKDFQHWAVSRRLVSRQGLFDEGYALHRLLTESFGDLAPKPFRWMIPHGGATGVLYGYSTTNAAALRKTALEFADPLQLKLVTDILNSKPMPTDWTSGRQLGFEVLVRPVVRRSRKGEVRPGKEYDAFQQEADRFPKNGMRRSREEVYRDWLQEQLVRIGGATLMLANMTSFQRTRVIRRLHSHYSEGPSAVMQGILAIEDACGFGHLLARGIGRHRSYGYGMILVRPPRKHL